MKKENFNQLQNCEKITYYNSVKCYGSEMICRFRILNYWKSEKIVEKWLLNGTLPP